MIWDLSKKLHFLVNLSDLKIFYLYIYIFYSLTVKQKRIHLYILISGRKSHYPLNLTYGLTEGYFYKKKYQMFFWSQFSWHVQYFHFCSKTILKVFRGLSVSWSVKNLTQALT